MILNVEALVQSPVSITMAKSTPLISAWYASSDRTEPGIPSCPLSMINLLNHPATVAICAAL